MENTKDTESLLKKLEVLRNDIKEMESIDSISAYKHAQIEIRKNSKKYLFKKITQYAAILTLPLLLTSLVLGYLHLDKPQQTEQFAEVTASTGSIIRYELPDQSVVWLNAGSTLRYPTNFSKNNRKVSLNGEAYFEVQADQENPFYVNTLSGMSLYVYGTQFNVTSYEDDSYIETVLERGNINVNDPNNQQTIKVLPGERILYNKETEKFQKTTVDVYEKTAWKEGKLIFRNTPIDEIFKRISRQFNVDIVVNNPSLKTYHLRATFRDETLPQIMDYIDKSVTLKWRAEDTVQQADGTFSKRKIIVDLY